jgi:acyl CoA:acetate/3-ketoacid CoA transferase alpha subunit
VSGQPAHAMAPGGLVTRLDAAIARHVAPGMHLHFAATPSRSNAAIRELARAFLGTRPGFCVSTTGFHSVAHLLPMLGLADRLIACFFGDHYPAPRPNPLYSRLAAAGVELEHWSLWSMVAAFRAGAQGDAWAIDRSLRGTSIAAELAARGGYREVALPGAAQPTLGLVAALRPDVTFVHAACADPDGHVVMAAPLSEGVASALAARRGVIVTVERIVTAAVTRAHAAAIALPPHRVLAICEEPFGAHPQPCRVPAGIAVAAYRDDFAAYERWRALTSDPAALAELVDRVLRAPDSGAAYRAELGAARLAALCEPAPPTITAHEPRPGHSAIDQLIVSAARQLAARTRAIGARVLIAGIGHAFFAARLAQHALAASGVGLRVMVETGLYDLDCGPDGHGYLLAADNMARARRLTGIDDVLGVLACGADNHCIAALGAAQIDRNGDLNSTRLGTTQLVGSGGACDIAAAAAEVVVITRLAPGRLVERVDYVTSPGRAVRSVVTERCVLTRDAGGWTLSALTPSSPATPLAAAAAAIDRDCPWRPTPAPDLEFAAPISREEARLLELLDPQGTFRQRAG